VTKKNTFLLLIGSGFNDPLSNEKRVNTLAKEYGNVKIINYKDDLKRSDYYCVSDFAVFTSSQEGEPTALVEAMSCGLPVIASNIPGHNELVIDEITGLLFKQWNRKDLIRCINKMINSTNDRIRWSRNSRFISVKNRDIKIITSKFISLIQKA